MPEPEDQFVDLLHRLNRAGVRYVLIGGLAMTLQGSAHVTYDVDIAYARTRENFAALAAALGELHATLRNVPADIPFVLDARTFQNTQNLTLSTDLAPLDLLGHVAGAEDFEDLMARSSAIEFENITVQVASIDDLIAMKRAANRLKDQLHVMELLALKKLIESGN